MLPELFSMAFRVVRERRRCDRQVFRSAFWACSSFTRIIHCYLMCMLALSWLWRKGALRDMTQARDPSRRSRVFGAALAGCQGTWQRQAQATVAATTFVPKIIAVKIIIRMPNRSFRLAPASPLHGACCGLDCQPHAEHELLACS